MYLHRNECIKYISFIIYTNKIKNIKYAYNFIQILKNKAKEHSYKFTSQLKI